MELTECGHELAGEGLELIVGQRDEVDLVSDIAQDLVDADGEGNQLALSQICSQRTKTDHSQWPLLPKNLFQTTRAWVLTPLSHDVGSIKSHTCSHTLSITVASCTFLLCQFTIRMPKAELCQHSGTSTQSRGLRPCRVHMSPWNLQRLHREAALF